MIKALVVDDSAFMRKAIQLMLDSDPEIQVVGMARDGQEGFEKVLELQPDIVTMDIEMPRTNGLEALELIMRHRPTPVIVVSSLTTEGAQVTLEALDKGAMDFIPKTKSYVALEITKIKDDLIRKVKALAKRKPALRVPPSPGKTEAPATAEAGAAEQPYLLSTANLRCIGIGVSTGGPPVVQAILTSLPADFPLPILVAQHMPATFTRTFAERLDGLAQITVKEAEEGDQLEGGLALIGKGGLHLLAKRQGLHTYAHLTPDPVENLYHPSADVLLNSIARSYGSGGLGIILTGMGHDGLEGARKLKSSGGKLLAQNEASCVIYGMPKAVVEAGLADAVLSIEGLIASLKTIRA